MIVDKQKASYVQRQLPEPYEMIEAVAITRKVVVGNETRRG